MIDQRLIDELNRDFYYAFEGFERYILKSERLATEWGYSCLEELYSECGNSPQLLELLRGVKNMREELNSRKV